MTPPPAHDRSSTSAQPYTPSSTTHREEVRELAANTYALDPHRVVQTYYKSLTPDTLCTTKTRRLRIDQALSSQTPSLVRTTGSTSVYRAEIRELDQREERLFDRFDTGEIARQTYDRQLTRLREAKPSDREAARRRRRQALAVPRHGVNRLELARDARSSIEARSNTEKAQLLSRVVCNSRLDGRIVRYDLKKASPSSRRCRVMANGAPSGI
jgi:hypothetical protein